MAERGIHGQLAGAGIDKGDQGRDKNGVVLPAALRCPYALRLVDLADRGQHRADQA
jgi:hypothetical protein